MTKVLKIIFVTLISMLVMTGCHHAVTTAKAPQTPPAQPAAPAATSVASSPSATQPHAVASKAPELTEEQLFARNVKDIFFSYDNAEVRAEEQPSLSADAAFLTGHPTIKVVIEGHCDERGSDEYNLSLGESRAARIRNALINGGVPSERIKVISYGKERPFCSSVENEACWQQNRRAHFVFQGQETTKTN